MVILARAGAIILMITAVKQWSGRMQSDGRYQRSTGSVLARVVVQRHRSGYISLGKGVKQLTPLKGEGGYQGKCYGSLSPHSFCHLLLDLLQSTPLTVVRVHIQKVEG